MLGTSLVSQNKKWTYWVDSSEGPWRRLERVSYEETLRELRPFSCSGSGWERGNLLHSSPCGEVLWVCD